MKVSNHTIFCICGSRCDNNEGNDVVKAHSERTDKLHQLSLVLEETEKSTARAIRGKMMLRVSQRLRRKSKDITEKVILQM